MPSTHARARLLWHRVRWPRSAAPHAGRGVRALATRAQQQRKPLGSPFDLPSEAPKDAPVAKYKLPDPEEVDDTILRLDEVTPEDVARSWPPLPLVEQPPPELEPPKPPDIWLFDQSTLGVSDVGRFVQLSRDDLIDLLPEGPCGQLARDLTLIPSSTRPVGLMIRKLMVELVAQLSLLRDATDPKGKPRIRKRGWLIDGRPGVGKSQVLNFLAMWARRNGWLVVMEPAASRYSHQIAEIKRSNSGVYIQNEFALQFLEATSIANRELLEEIHVDAKAYGMRAIDGESVRATKGLYNPLIETTVEREVSENGLGPAERLERIAAYKAQIRLPSMAQQLPRPVKVWEIVEFGLQHEAYATQAVFEMLLQLKRQTQHPVLVLVDEWNECFPASEYVSVRYDNTRFHGHIPAYHLTMPRAFHRWDGDSFRRGLKICATSWMRSRRRDYRPELLGVEEHERRTVRNFSQYEFANYVTYLRFMKVLHQFPREDLDYYYMLTQGNGVQARKMLSTLY